MEGNLTETAILCHKNDKKTVLTPSIKATGR
jgi:hypothetical protein